MVCVAAFGSAGCDLMRSDPHDSQSRQSWMVVSMSEDGTLASVVYERTGIQYVALIDEDKNPRMYSMCERYGSDGLIMHDGDATRGGAFGMEVIEEDDETVIYRDTQTGVAYLWHRWYDENAGYTGQGLVVYRNGNGDVMRWDDDRFLVAGEAPGADDEDSADVAGDDDADADGGVAGEADADGASGDDADDAADDETGDAGDEAGFAYGIPHGRIRATWDGVGSDAGVDEGDGSDES